MLFPSEYHMRHNNSYHWTKGERSECRCRHAMWGSSTEKTWMVLKHSMQKPHIPAWGDSCSTTLYSTALPQKSLCFFVLCPTWRCRWYEASCSHITPCDLFFMGLFLATPKFTFCQIFTFYIYAIKLKRFFKVSFYEITFGCDDNYFMFYWINRRWWKIFPLNHLVSFLHFQKGLN